jgi:hypothetical protein
MRRGPYAYIYIKVFRGNGNPHSGQTLLEHALCDPDNKAQQRIEKQVLRLAAKNKVQARWYILEGQSSASRKLPRVGLAGRE